jgi:hypothetical protein
MRKIRKGKDFVVMWPIFRRNANGEREPYSIDQLTAQLRVQQPIGEAFKADEVSIEDNMVTWIFRGKSQIYSGIYNLILVENDGADGMVTVDTCKAFNLVEHSCDENVDGGSDIVIETVTLESDVALAPVVLEVGEDYDDTELREAIADLQEKDKATDTQLAALQQKDAQTEAKLTELSAETLSFQVVGNDTTLVFSDIKRNIVPGHRYRLTIKNPDIDMSGVGQLPESYIRLSILSYDEANNRTKLIVEIPATYPLQPFYDVTLPENSKGLGIATRATKGKV